MPEGDTLFRAARTLHRALSGQVLTGFETGFAQLSAAHDQSPLTGQTVEEVSAAGKHLMMRLSDGRTLRTHMRMSGSWHLYRPGEGWREPRSAARIVLHTAPFVAVAFRVPVAELEDARTLARSLSRLGPDVLSPGFDEGLALRNLRAAGALPIGEALLRQHLLSGLGNVFKSEVLFVCGIHPGLVTSAIPEGQLLTLIRESRRLMQANVTDTAGDAIVTYSGFRRTTGRSDPSARLWVYGRFREPCRKCGTPIRLGRQGLDNRSTYWCPRCQLEPGTPRDCAW